jgi:hypothetical protein
VKERPLVKSLAAEQSADAALGVLSHFRVEFYDCLYTRADALFELADAVLCSDGPVTSLVELTLTAEHRRGHGAMEPRRLRRLLASTNAALDCSLEAETTQLINELLHPTPRGEVHRR